MIPSSMSPVTQKMLTQHLTRLAACIEDIRDWMCRNNLKLNDSKTEFLTLGSRLQLSKLGDMSIRIDGDNIPVSESAKNIGIVFDSTMEYG